MPVLSKTITSTWQSLENLCNLVASRGQISRAQRPTGSTCPNLCWNHLNSLEMPVTSCHYKGTKKAAELGIGPWNLTPLTCHLTWRLQKRLHCLRHQHFLHLFALDTSLYFHHLAYLSSMTQRTLWTLPESWVDCKSIAAPAFQPQSWLPWVARLESFWQVVPWANRSNRYGQIWTVRPVPDSFSFQSAALQILQEHPGVAWFSIASVVYAWCAQWEEHHCHTLSVTHRNRIWTDVLRFDGICVCVRVAFKALFTCFGCHSLLGWCSYFLHLAILGLAILATQRGCQWPSHSCIAWLRNSWNENWSKGWHQGKT